MDSIVTTNADDIIRNDIIDPAAINPPIGPMVRSYMALNGGIADDKEMVTRILYSEVGVHSDKWEHNARFIPGCTLDGRIGPRPSKVMVIGKIASMDFTQAADSEGAKLGLIESENLDLLLGAGRRILLGGFAEVGIPASVYQDFYATNLIRFSRIDGGVKKAIPTEWIRECAHYLQQELHIVQPDIILCLGSEPSKVLTKLPITKAQGRVFDVQITQTKAAKVVCVYDPRAVLDRFESRPIFVAGLHLFTRVLRGENIDAAKDRQFFYVDNEQDLSIVVDELIKAGLTEFSVDCEWGGGQHCLDANAKLRTIQIAWSGKEALVVILHRAGMKEAFDPFVSSAITHIRRLLSRPEVKIIGHNVAADFGFLYEYGLDLAANLYFDTMLASHLFEPTGAHDLDSLAVRYIPGWIRHDAELLEWKKENPNLVTSETAYGNIPDDILHPYGACDVCATFLVYKIYAAKLAMAQSRNMSRLFWDLVMPATLAFIEIERNGVYMDRPGLMWMSAKYQEKYEELLHNFRITINQANFNPNSSAQKVDLLYNKLGLDPVKTTGKYPMMWDEVPSDKLHLYAPAVDDETLGILAAKSPVANGLQDICLIGTVLKSFLTPKVLNKTTGTMGFKKGLIGFIKRDGRLHPYISQMVKTGRLAAHEPNLMNMPNQQEAAIQMAAGGGLPGIRSCFMAAPGWLIVCADYKQAEVAVLAYLSGDLTLIQAVETGSDIHSMVAIKMFKLNCTPAEVKKSHKNLRVAAKSILFGLIYGRGAKAISREVEKAGVPCSQEDAQGFINSFMEQFPLVAQFIKVTQKFVEERSYVETLWGRKEFFYKVEGDEGAIAARQKRQGVNYVIQSYVADLLRVALINLQKYRREHSIDPYKLILTVHDSIMIETPIRYVPEVAQIVLPWAMTEAAPAPGMGFRIGCDVDVVRRWDEKLYLQEMLDMGLPKDFSLKFCAKEDDGSPKEKQCQN